MRTVLLVILLLSSTSAAQGRSVSTSGSWIVAGTSAFCGSGSLCVEWHQPGDPLDGFSCCISSSDLANPPNLGACQSIVEGPRPDPNDQDPAHLGSSTIQIQPDP